MSDVILGYSKRNVNVIAEFESGGYDWDSFIVFEYDNKLFIAHDSGCSCYGPWEDDPYDVNDFDQIHSEQDVIKYLREFRYNITEDEKLDIVKDVRGYLNRVR